MQVKQLLEKFLQQAQSGGLKTSEYPKEFKGYTTKVSFGMGAPAHIPWIALTAPDITVSNGYFPVYLYYKSLNTLILAFGISETNEYSEPWTLDIQKSHQTIEEYFGEKVRRYGDSYVFKAYVIDKNLNIRNADENQEMVSEVGLEADLNAILNKYQEVTNTQVSDPQSAISKGSFYLEKQLEDFIIENWNHTELGKELDLIVEDGELKSQQYRTDIGPIDILAKDKSTGSYVVIELKKGQTSDDTVGQIARYMGWVEEKFNDNSVRGIIIAKGFDRKLEYALKRLTSVEVFIYEVDFRLKEFTK